jgi:SH3 domain protein
MRFFIAVMALLPLAAAAETAYVTDNLRLGLHQLPDTSDRAFRMLDSGQQVEVLFRDGNYASVQLPDGAQGHVKAAYLVSEKPARLILAETIAERDALQAELEEARNQFAAPAATIDNLKAEVAGLTERLDGAQVQITKLQAENASIDDLKQHYKGSLPLTWVAAAIGVCLIAGFLIGMWWVDLRIRKRHGGIRIY